MGLAASRLNDEQFKPSDFTGGLGSKCFRLLENAGFQIVRKNDFDVYPDDIAAKEHWEGATTSVRVNKYERNADARNKCIRHYGAQCLVCTADFGELYGDLGRGYIHVHHVVPLAEIGERYQVDPINDLRPVCPNCHAMLHRGDPPLSIEALKALIAKSGKGSR